MQARKRKEWTMRKMVFVALAVGFVGSYGSPSEARSLAGQLSSFVTQNVIFPGVHNVDTITPVFLRLASQATDFPVPPTTPGYVFTYNPTEGVFERSTGSLGPVFLERVETVGENHAAIGVSYLYGNVNQFDGSNFAQGFNTRVGIVATDPSTGRNFEGGTTIDKLELPTNRFNFAATYGVTDNLDVGLLLPLVVTKLTVAGRGYVGPSIGGQPNPTTEAAAVFGPSMGFSDTSTGIGDLLVRAKYRFGYLADFGFAGGFTLRCPTGDENDFHGLGDWTVAPLLIISRTFGLNDFHANMGMEFNAGNSQASRALYGIGATLQAEQFPWVAFLLDFLGASYLDNQTFNQTVRVNPQIQTAGFVAPFLTSQRQNPDGSFTLTSTIPRADQFNVAVGLKFAIWGNALGYVNALVPLTRQGLQADVISAGGVEYSF